MIWDSSELEHGAKRRKRNESVRRRHFWTKEQKETLVKLIDEDEKSRKTKKSLNSVSPEIAAEFNELFELELTLHQIRTMHSKYRNKGVEIKGIQSSQAPKSVKKKPETVPSNLQEQPKKRGPGRPRKMKPSTENTENSALLKPHEEEQEEMAKDSAAPIRLQRLLAVEEFCQSLKLYIETAFELLS